MKEKQILFAWRSSCSDGDLWGECVLELGGAMVARKNRAMDAVKYDLCVIGVTGRNAKVVTHELRRFVGGRALAAWEEELSKCMFLLLHKCGEEGSWTLKTCCYNLESLLEAFGLEDLCMTRTRQHCVGGGVFSLQDERTSGWCEV